MARKSLRQWLAAANGWQRIWFVCSVICFLYFIVLFPLIETDKGSAFRYEMRWAAEREMKNPMCGVYMTGDFSKLVKPEYSTDGSTCYHVYNHRMYRDGNSSITEEKYQEDFNNNERITWLKFIGAGTLFAVFWMSLLYGVGVVIKWIVNGFKRKETP